ncbi:argininosuccinate synthase domain-containing protein [Plantactinospora sp. KLBMP9567]|uniref:argininosuccinate synthase domain-containing protein n=1 Tax=Plantactinospora sp. KLBMP9567 TaxID=3085900 RepID=UPI002980A301|nr:argininosuccinate synthase domain-containing protein [Plantactinospora sp. KLBMP9567]MDW5329516.1 argininosuccinate synthase [Plantactinospora sp. KLBMP9567]
MGRFVTTLDDLAGTPPRHLLLLYSGGVDGTYLLRWLRQQRIRVTALHVGFGDEPDADQATRHAASMGVAIRWADATAEFFAEFVPAAIHADAYYQGQFPVGSTLSRPLMARTAVRVARKLGCDCVAHTATYMQNSAARLTRSIAALAPGLDVAAPFLGTDVPREEKVRSLREAGIEYATGIHSIDANPWARVIECGPLESPENVLTESVFTLTRNVADCPAVPAEFDLEFRAGLPIRLDGAALGLAELVTRLNELGGEHGVGRFSGLEDTAFGVKNHEVRESPAAAVITAAHRALANAVFSAREHTIRAGLAAEWTTTVVHGGWFGHLAGCLARCLAELDRPLEGVVRMRLHAGTVTLLRLMSPNGLYYARLGDEFHDWMGSFSYGPWLTLTTLADRTRGGTDRSAP